MLGYNLRMTADALEGALLGTAIGDALGLPLEGMRPAAVDGAKLSRDRFAFLGRTGFVSDDTEQSALVAQSLARHPNDLAACVRAFRWSLLGWFLRLPWAIGFGTLRACVRIAFGARRTGVASAGNGAAMRAAVVGVFFADDPALRRAFGDALAEVTHTDPRAVQGARFVAELAAVCAKDGAAARAESVERALAVVDNADVRAAVKRGQELAEGAAELEAAARELGTTGFIVHTVALATFCFVRLGDDPAGAIAAAVRAGGDTDSNAAIVGAWMGARHGASGLPAELVGHLQGGPFGRDHLRALAADLALARRPDRSPPRAGYAWTLAFARNLLLFPVVLVHAFRVVAVNVFGRR